MSDRSFFKRSVRDSGVSRMDLQLRSFGALQAPQDDSG